MERWGALLLTVGVAMIAVAAIIERIQWHQRRASTTDIRKMFVIGVILMGLGMLLMGIAPVPSVHRHDSPASFVAESVRRGGAATSS
jgi:hypothetical protein